MKTNKKKHWADKFIKEPLRTIRSSNEYGLKKITTYDDINKIYKSISTSLSEIEFLKIISIIHSNGGKVYKNGSFKFSLYHIDKIINDYKVK